MAQLSARQVQEADTRLIADAGKIRFFPLVVERGEGCRIIDPDGRRYLDFTSAWARSRTPATVPVRARRDRGGAPAQHLRGPRLRDACTGGEARREAGRAGARRLREEGLVRPVRLRCQRDGRTAAADGHRETADRVVHRGVSRDYRDLDGDVRAHCDDLHHRRRKRGEGPLPQPLPLSIRQHRTGGVRGARHPLPRGLHLQDHLSARRGGRDHPRAAPERRRRRAAAPPSFCRCCPISAAATASTLRSTR